MTVTELVEALEAEMQSVRADVKNWGLDPQGEEAVLSALSKFEFYAGIDLAKHQANAGIDVRPALAVRLENVKLLKTACAIAMQNVKRCEWLSQWMEVAEPLNSTFLAPSKKTQLHLVQ